MSYTVQKKLSSVDESQGCLLIKEKIISKND